MWTALNREDEESRIDPAHSALGPIAGNEKPVGGCVALASSAVDLQLGGLMSPGERAEASPTTLASKKER